MSGLTVRPDDCPITKCVRAALYATNLQPSEDDVTSIVVAIREDLTGPIHQGVLEMRNEATQARRDAWNINDNLRSRNYHRGREKALSRAFGLIEDTLFGE